MGLIGNGRAKSESTPLPHSVSGILTRASQTLDGPQQLKELIAAVTLEPRAAINRIEQEIGWLRELLADREQTLVEAIDQHANLSKEAVRGMGVVQKALSQIGDAFNAAMRPIPDTRSPSQAEESTER